MFLGPPGAGKGTQAARLAAHVEIPRISTGDMLRDAIAHGTPIGQKAAPLIEKGQLVPDDLLIEMIGERLGQPDCRPGYILDGFPRTLNQAKAFTEMLKGDASQFVIFKFDVPRGELLKRLSGRRWCPTCQATYHVQNNPPKQDALCDKDGTTVIQREDDKEVAVERRLRDYDALTEPIVQYYRDRAHFHEIDGFAAPDMVFSKLTAALDVPREAAR